MGAREIGATTGDPGPHGWPAELFLRFGRREARTVLLENRHRGPARVQRPFYPEASGRAHVYLLHPPGGYVGGDRQALDVRCEPNAQVLLTTPSATKCYRSLGPTVSLQQTLSVARGARLEWLPQETIVFNGARVRNAVRVDLDSEAAFLGWDILCLGRPASAEQFSSGFFSQRLSVWRDGGPLWVERGDYEGGSVLLQDRFGLGGHTVTATFICTSVGGSVLDLLRSEGECTENCLSVSQNGDILVARYLGASADEARKAFVRLWRIVRREEWHAPACEPRVWST